MILVDGSGRTGGVTPVEGLVPRPAISTVAYGRVGRIGNPQLTGSTNAAANHYRSNSLTYSTKLPRKAYTKIIEHFMGDDGDDATLG